MNNVIEKTHRVLRVMGEAKGQRTTQGPGGAAARGRGGRGRAARWSREGVIRDRGGAAWEGWR